MSLVNNRRKKLSVYHLFVICLFTSSTSQALTINLNPTSTSTPGPNQFIGSGNLDSVMAAAAHYWEGIVSDNKSITVDYEWENSSSTGNYSPTRNKIVFGNQLQNWYIDGTPDLNEEFSIIARSSKNFGAGDLVYERYLGGGTGRDLYTNALHEIGHKLGFYNPKIFVEIKNGKIGINSPRPFAGSTIPTEFFSPHLDAKTLGLSLMVAGANPGTRILPSQVDILAVAEAGKYTQALELGSIISAGSVETIDVSSPNPIEQYKGSTGDDVVPTVLIGRNNNGSLDIDGGNRLTADSVAIGAGHGKTGYMTVSGSGSELVVNEDFDVGGNIQGRGYLRVENGATVTRTNKDRSCERSEPRSYPVVGHTANLF